MNEANRSIANSRGQTGSLVRTEMQSTAAVYINEGQ